AISTTGTMEPRRLKIPIRNVGESGTLVRFGHSTTSSTSRTERQNRSRPARNMQYWRSGAARGSNSSCSGSDKGSSCCCSAIYFKSTHQLLHCADQFCTGKRFGHIAIRSLLCGPELIAFSVLGADQDHWNARIFVIALQFPAGLKAISLGHDHIHQDEAGALHVNHLLYTQRIMDGYREISPFV